MSSKPDNATGEIPFGEPEWAASGSTSPYYKESHRTLRKKVRKFLEEEIFPHAEEWELAGEVPRSAIQAYASKGFALTGLPRQYRGGQSLPFGINDQEWDIFHSLIVTQESHRCPRMGVTWGLLSGNAIGCAPILNFGTEEQKMRYLPDVYAGRTRFCLGITEPSAGSDVARIRTSAVLNREGTHYIVTGEKKWITNGVWADYVTAAVRTGPPESGAEGLSVLVIPLKNTKGVTVRRMHVSGLNASGSTFIIFNDVLVPKENLIGRLNEGFKIIMSNFNSERLLLAVGALSMARTCYSEAFKHATRRKTFGKPLMGNQIIRSKFASMVRSIETCDAWVEQLAWQMKTMGVANPSAGRGIGARIALAKVQAGKTLELCCREAQQIFGGTGMTREGPGKVVEQISRDLRVFVVGGGSEEILDDLGIRMILERPSKTRTRL